MDKIIMNVVKEQNIKGRRASRLLKLVFASNDKDIMTPTDENRPDAVGPKVIMGADEKQMDEMYDKINIHKKDKIDEKINEVKEEYGEKEKKEEKKASAEEETPEDGDYTLNPSGSLGGKTYVGVVNEKGLGEFNDEDEAIEAIRKDMDKNGFWPNVWRISDHGNSILIDITKEASVEKKAEDETRDNKFNIGDIVSDPRHPEYGKGEVYSRSEFDDRMSVSWEKNMAGQVIVKKLHPNTWENLQVVGKKEASVNGVEKKSHRMHGVYTLTVVDIDPITGQEILKSTRTEDIDTRENELYESATNAEDVKRIYVWNETVNNPTELVRVINVTQEDMELLDLNELDGVSTEELMALQDMDGDVESDKAYLKKTRGASIKQAEGNKVWISFEPGDVTEGIIKSKNDDGTYVIDWEDGSSNSNVKKEDLIWTEEEKNEAKKIASSSIKQAEWQDKLQTVYDNNFEQFVGYDETYKIAQRLGFDTPEDAWDANPVIAGSTDPKELKIVDEKKAELNNKTANMATDQKKFIDSEHNGIKVEVLPNGDLKMIVTDKEVVEDAKDLGDLLDSSGLLGNGFSWVLPEDVGALTSADMIGYGSYDDDGKWDNGPVWAYMDYQVMDPMEELKEKGEIIWTYGPDNSEVEETENKQAAKRVDVAIQDNKNGEITTGDFLTNIPAEKQIGKEITINCWDENGMPFYATGKLVEVLGDDVEEIGKKQ